MYENWSIPFCVVNVFENPQRNKLRVPRDFKNHHQWHRIVLFDQLAVVLRPRSQNRYFDCNRKNRMAIFQYCSCDEINCAQCDFLQSLLHINQQNSTSGIQKIFLGHLSHSNCEICAILSEWPVNALQHCTFTYWLATYNYLRIQKWYQERNVSMDTILWWWTCI